MSIVWLRAGAERINLQVHDNAFDLHIHTAIQLLVVTRTSTQKRTNSCVTFRRVLIKFARCSKILIFLRQRLHDVNTIQYVSPQTAYPTQGNLQNVRGISISSTRSSILHWHFIFDIFQNKLSSAQSTCQWLYETDLTSHEARESRNHKSEHRRLGPWISKELQLPKIPHGILMERPLLKHWCRSAR